MRIHLCLTTTAEGKPTKQMLYVWIRAAAQNISILDNTDSIMLASLTSSPTKSWGMAGNSSSTSSMSRGRFPAEHTPNSMATSALEHRIEKMEE
jgi:hypothetical protein